MRYIVQKQAGTLYDIFDTEQNDILFSDLEKPTVSIICNELNEFEKTCEYRLVDSDGAIEPGWVSFEDTLAAATKTNKFPIIIERNVEGTWKKVAKLAELE